MNGGRTTLPLQQLKAALERSVWAVYRGAYPMHRPSAEITVHLKRLLLSGIARAPDLLGIVAVLDSIF